MKKTIICLLSALAIAASAVGQKLPNKQERSVWAPADIKIDGTAAEWKDEFQAYNKATDIFYTVSNDDKNLYLTVQARLNDIIDKILRGGITFAVSADKGDKNDVAITYPFMEGPDMWAVANRFNNRRIAFTESKKAEADATNVKAVNDVYGTNEKLMKITGVENITDPAISVYNETSIRVAAHFDNKLAFTYELAIPLAYLKFSDKGPFRYHIKLNEDPPAKASVAFPPPVPQAALATTDFWGQYTLAKK